MIVRTVGDQKQQRHANEHADDADQQVANQNADPAKQGAAGAGYLGGDAKMKTGTTGVSEVDKKSQSYGHGAFMGAAGAFMKDPTWNQIFKTVWPEEFERIKVLEDTREAMLALENNPVLAAYGECQSMENKGEKKGEADPKQMQVVPQEWDVWLDKENPGDLSKVRIAHGNFWTTVMQNITAGQKDKVVGAKRDDVKNAKSGSQWMETFGRAVMMYRGGGGSVPDNASQKDKEGQAAKMQAAAKATNAEQAISACAEFLKKENGGGLILDVKSTYSSSADINLFIDTLRGKGVDVFGVGTFRHEQLAGLEKGVRPVKFFHGIQGVENAADQKALQKGDHLMFNAGSLLDKSGGWIRDTKYGINQAAFQQLSTLVTTYDLNVGLYVQEGDVDEKAVEVIVKMVNKFPDLFKDGFAYGNIQGRAETETEGTGMGAQGNADRLDKAKGTGHDIKEGAGKAVDKAKELWDKVF
jgi:hypothetical protein